MVTIILEYKAQGAKPLPLATRLSSTTFYHSSLRDEDDKTLFLMSLEGEHVAQQFP